MSEEPGTYSHSRLLAARKALEDTIRAELSRNEIAKLAAILTYAQREGLGAGDVFRALCAVEPAVTDLPQQLDEHIRGQVIEGAFGDGPTRPRRAPRGS